MSPKPTDNAKQRVVIYAALSKKKNKADDDRHDEESTDSQIAKVQTRVAQLYGDVELVGVFSETGFSGSKRAAINPSGPRQTL